MIGRLTREERDELRAAHALLDRLFPEYEVTSQDIRYLLPWATEITATYIVLELNGEPLGFDIEALKRNFAKVITERTPSPRLYIDELDHELYYEPPAPTRFTLYFKEPLRRKPPRKVDWSHEDYWKESNYPFD